MSTYALLEDYINRRCDYENCCELLNISVFLRPEPEDDNQEDDNKEDLKIMDALHESGCSFMKLFLDRLDRDCKHDDFNSKDALLHIAVAKQDLELIDVLLVNGANVNSINPYLYSASPLHVAAEYSNPTILKLLIDHGAEANIKDSSGANPLHCLSDLNFQPDNNLAAMKILIDHGADAEQADNKGYRPIHHAVLKCPDCVMYLIEYGVDINVRSDTGTSALGLSDGYGVDIMELLLNEGASMLIDDDFSPFNSRRTIEMLSHCGSTSFRYPDDAIMLGKIIIKSDVAGISVNKQDLHIIRTDCEKYWPHDFGLISEQYNHNLSLYEKELEKEVAIMKCHKIFESISLYDVFVDECPKYRSNATLVANLNSLDYKKFAEYEDLIRRKINLDRMKYDLINSVFDLLMRFRDPFCDRCEQTLPDELIVKILYNLEIWNLRKIIRCDTNPEK